MPLPRSLDPLPAESLPGFMLRLAHRLDMTPTQLAQATGLDGGRRQSTMASSVIFALDPPLTATFAHATRLTLAEVTDLTLASLAPRYPPLDQQWTGRRRTAHGVFIRENWIFARFSRYCAECLAGDGSPIQNRHGGAWSKLWRVPVVFACPAHRWLLRHTCPGCGNPAHQRRPGSPQLLPLAAHPVTHPAACRNPTTSTAPYQPCGYRLDNATDAQTARASISEESLHLQRRLLALLRSDRPPAVVSVGQPTSPARYFADLRILTTLLTASWPAGRSVLAPGQVDTVDAYIRQLRHEITAARDAGRNVLEIRVYDRPPADAAVAAALLGAADQMLTCEPAILGDLLRDMFDASRPTRKWVRRALGDDERCSPGFLTVAGTASGTQHIIRKLGLPETKIPPRRVGFGLHHIPQYLPTGWYSTYFNSVDADERWVRRAVPVILARMVTGGGLRHAGTLLGLPWSAARHAVATVTRQLTRPKCRVAFDDAVEALTDRLHHAESRVDYGRRRDALATWSLSGDEWRDLTSGLVGKPVNGKGTLHVDWSDSKRLLASVWIWTKITQSEHHFSPLLRPDPRQAKPGGALSVYVHVRWPFLASGHGHYAELRSRLDTFAEDLSHRIDGTAHRQASKRG
ncbi:TniQ family protein [Catellatospora bangladeshensis]|nr:TniQ family protein [Catellatospora bangladeshensis]